MDVALDLDISFSSLEFQQLLDGFNSSHDDDQQAESCEDLGWIEEDFEEESEFESGMSGNDQSASSTSVEDQMKQQEDLLAEWSQIEAELGIMDVVKPAGKNTNTYESTGMEMEAVLADWYLIEESLKAEEQLKDVGSRCAGNDEAMKIKIEQIVLSAKDRIKDILATAQEEIQQLKKATDTYGDLLVTVSPTILIHEDDTSVIEPEPTIIRELWPDNDHNISVDNSDRLSLNQLSSDIDSDVEDLQLYLELSCDEEDRDHSLQSTNSGTSEAEKSCLCFQSTDPEDADVKITMLCHKLNPDQCVVSSETNDKVDISTKAGAKHCHPS